MIKDGCRDSFDSVSQVTTQIIHGVWSENLQDNHVFSTRVQDDKGAPLNIVYGIRALYALIRSTYESYPDDEIHMVRQDLQDFYCDSSNPVFDMVPADISLNPDLLVSYLNQGAEHTVRMLLDTEGFLTDPSPEEWIRWRDIFWKAGQQMYATGGIAPDLPIAYWTMVIILVTLIPFRDEWDESGWSEIVSRARSYYVPVAA